ncbi:transposase family protein [Diaphorobacter sp. HDW4A]|uniref:integrase catalytic domain-containing protein n=1 Tax=Diaphorobacter sp. HDW4A TaxID=2714924 RepID=UPI001409979B|nr:DDE-type integrase/transposase/recombinase [Diaphorobacter sp. HDW4A]QIL81764.1 transposase family protein [Diaphorobacter sp. HDW4A]
MDAIRMEVITNAAHEVAAADHGARGLIVQRTAELLNLSVQRTYTLVSKAAAQLGLKTPRKRRADAGDSAISDAELELIAGTILHDRRAGKWMIPLSETIDALHSNGKIATRLSANHVGRLLRDRGLDRRSLSAPTPHVSMRTEHINAVWQIDASVCVLFKTPKGELRLLEEDGVHYKNKPENLKRVMDQLLVRFVGAEHASGAIAVRFYSGGETTENALDFLMWMMGQRQDAAGTPMPLHGVPYLIYTDQGSAFKSTSFRNFCSAMEIRQKWHAPKKSRSTGSAEGSQNIVERGLESRLKFIDPETITIARLNALGELWMHSRNGTKKHSRHGMTPYAAWSTIGSEHLRLAPSMEIMRELPVSLAQTRVVSGNMTVSFALKGQGSSDYDLRYVQGVSPRDKVLVSVNPFAAPAVRVGVTDRETGEIVWHQIEPVKEGWMGYRADAPRLDKDEYKAMPATPADERRARIAAQAYATAQGPATPAQVEAAQKAKTAPYVGQFDPFADIKEKAASLPTYMQRPGTPHSAFAPSVEPVRKSVAEVCKRMRLELGDVYEPSTYGWLTERYGDAGVPEDVVPGLIAARRQALCNAPVKGGLRAVGGGA